MQETRNNCFETKKCSTTHRQAKTGKHECQNVAGLCEFLASYGVIFKMIFNQLQNASLKLASFFVDHNVFLILNSRKKNYNALLYIIGIKIGKKSWFVGTL